MALFSPRQRRARVVFGPGDVGDDLRLMGRRWRRMVEEGRYLHAIQERWPAPDLAREQAANSNTQVMAYEERGEARVIVTLTGLDDLRVYIGRDREGEPYWRRALEHAKVTHRPAFRDAPRVWIAALVVLSACNGVIEPNLGARNLDVRAQLGLSLAAFGAVLAAFPIGLLFGGAVATVILDRVGTRRVLLLGGVLFWSPLGLIGTTLLFAPTGAPATLILVVLWGLAGVGNGLLDPAQAALATEFQGRSTSGRQLTQVFQAAQAAGTLLGAAVAAGAIAFGIGAGEHFIAVGAVTVVVGLGGIVMLPDLRTRPSADEARRPTPDERPNIRLVGLVALGLVASASVVPLGAALGWSTTVLSALGAPDSLVGLGAVSFTTAQLIGTLSAFGLSRRVRPQTLALTGGVLTALGVTAVGAGSSVILALAGFMAMGVGLSPIPGLAIATAFNVRAGGLGLGARIGIVANATFLGAGVALPLVGVLAAAIGPTQAFTWVVGVCVVAVLSGNQLLRHARP